MQLRTALTHRTARLAIESGETWRWAPPVAPGGIESGLFDIKAHCPMARHGEANEVAEAVVWLCSDRSSYVTGIALPVDGGYWAW